MPTTAKMVEGAFCTGCGSPHVINPGTVYDLCTRCFAVLNQKMQAIREAIDRDGGPSREAGGSNFLAIYAGQDGRTIGVGIYVSEMPAQAMAEAYRTAQRNGWLLLRVDIQRSLKDIYVHELHEKYFPGSRTKPLAFDEDLYGNIPMLYPGCEVRTREVEIADPKRQGPVPTPESKRWRDQILGWWRRLVAA